VLNGQLDPVVGAEVAEALRRIDRELFVAHLGADSLKRLCETAAGSPITPGQLVPLISDADIERVVYAGESREILDLGTKTRFFTGPLRRAIQLRDRQCVEPGCRIPADQCEVDHDTPNSLGGPTNQFNGKCRCRTSHRHKSRTDGSQPRPRDDPASIDTS
jgi:hypothetical protein